MDGTSDNVASGSAPSAPAAAPSAVASLERASASLESASSAGSSAPAGPQGTPNEGAIGPSAAGVVARPTGEAPESRIQAAVANARRELTDRLGWAEHLDREEVQDAVDMLRELSSNPREFMARLQQELQGDEIEPDPDPDLVSPDGKVKAYSHAAVAKLLGNLEKRLSKQFRPALEYATESRASQAVQSRIAEYQRVGREALSEARKMPHFTEHEALISQKLADMNPEYRRSIGAIAALHVAYTQVLQEKVFPTLRQQTEQEVLSGFKKSANSSAGSVQPGGGTSGKPVLKDGDVDGLAKHLEHLYKQATA
mgnify:CR=1 FL=1